MDPGLDLPALPCVHLEADQQVVGGGLLDVATDARDQLQRVGAFLGAPGPGQVERQLLESVGDRATFGILGLAGNAAREAQRPGAVAPADDLVVLVALGLVAQLYGQVLVLPREHLHHATERAGSVVGRRGAANDVDRPQQQRVDERRRDTGAAIADDAHPGDERHHPMAAHAANREHLEVPALSVLRYAGDLAHDLGHRGDRCRRLLRIDARRGDADG